LPRHLNSLPTPFEDCSKHSGTELLRVWLTEDERIVHRANFNVPKSKDVAIYGVALAVLAQDIAAEAARRHGLDPTETQERLIEYLRMNLGLECE